jgi:subtilase family serine protease
LRLLSVPGLAPGASTLVEFPAWIAVLGAHQLRATADALARIAEPVEQDNDLERGIVVGAVPRRLPDLGVAAIDLSPSGPRAGQLLSFVASVENTGGNALPAFVVRFTVDDLEVGEVVVAGLPRGRSARCHRRGRRARRAAGTSSASRSTQARPCRRATRAATSWPGRSASAHV